MSIRMLHLFAAAAVTTACAASVCPAAPEGEAPAPTETLEALVTEVVDLQVEQHAEETRWKEEKAHLETTRVLLEKENEKLESELADDEAEADAAESRREQLTRRIREATTLLTRVDWSVRGAAEKLLESFEDLPDPLKKPLSNGATRVRNALASREESLNVADRFRLVGAFASDLNRTLSAVHVVKQTLDTPGDDGERREMDVLYIGGAIGYYVSPDDAQAGVIARQKGQWRCTPQNDLARTVRAAIAVFRKEKPAALVDLPVVGDEEREEEE